MAEALVIPDCHLKPMMFNLADDILGGNTEVIPCILGDLVDDFGRQYNLELYDQTFERVFRFIEKYKRTIFLYGNHDVSYLWRKEESGYSPSAIFLVEKRLRKLQAKMASNIGFVKRLDNVIFSHAGLTENFVEAFFSVEKKGIDYLIDRINDSSAEVLWTGDSPIWSRPQFNDRKKMYMQGQYMQVVGHTPVQKVIFDPDRGLLSTDVWSTYRNGQKYGEEMFVFVDTVNKTWKYA